MLDNCNMENFSECLISRKTKEMFLSLNIDS